MWLLDVPLNTESASTVIAVDTMDFSLPTYGDAVGGKIKDNLKAPPGFNPFGDLDFTRKEEVVVDKEEKKVDESPKMPSISLPKVEMPKMESKPSPPALDSVEMPKIELPKVDMPKVEMPKVDIPKVDMPDMPKVSLPKFSMPKMDAPKLDMPAYNLDIPKVDVPKVDIPKVDIPKVDLPKVNLPNPFSGGGGGSTVDNDLNLESRDIRDERARVARKDFLGADDDVKDAEEKLQALKRIRQSKKERASAAKDLACADRPGGKFFCLRNPFSAGF